MGFFTDWFIADECEAAAVASTVTTMEHSSSEWTYLSLQCVSEYDLAVLWRLLLDQPIDSMPSVSAQVLFQTSEEKGPVVSSIEPDFLALLAKVKLVDQARLAPIWAAADETMTIKDQDFLNGVIGKMADFARVARYHKKPVLQLVMKSRG